MNPPSFSLFFPGRVSWSFSRKVEGWPSQVGETRTDLREKNHRKRRKCSSRMKNFWRTLNERPGCSLKSSGVFFSEKQTTGGRLFCEDWRWWSMKDVRKKVIFRWYAHNKAQHQWGFNVGDIHMCHVVFWLSEYDMCHFVVGFLLVKHGSRGFSQYISAEMPRGCRRWTAANLNESPNLQRKILWTKSWFMLVFHCVPCYFSGV